MSLELYLYDIKVDSACLTFHKGLNAHAIISMIDNLLSCCRYKFKVAGEYRVVAVMEKERGREHNLEQDISKLATIGISDITCIPLTTYAHWNGEVRDKWIYWNEMTIGNNGMNSWDAKAALTKEMMDLFRSENNGKFVLFKHKNCQKMTVFISVDNADDAESVFNGLLNYLLLRSDAHNVRNVCREVQHLDNYTQIMQLRS